MVQVKDNLVGRQFGKLTVLCQADDYIEPKSGKHHARWLCECSCEEHNQVAVLGSYLKNHKTQSCGCIAKERLIKYNQETKKKTNKYDEPFIEYGIGYCSNTNNQFYFDIEDYELIKDYCWCEHIKTNGYHTLEAWSVELQRVVRMTEVLGCKHHDHRNRNPLDNRRGNLRKSTQEENTRNKSKQSNNSSGVSGVGWMARLQKWRARITYNEQKIYLGVFESKKDAIIARLKAEKEYFGEFAPQKELFEQYGV